MHGRITQLIALVVMVVASTACGLLLPPILRQTEDAGLRYTDVSVEGAPPYVALGTAIGALRGLIVDYLWIKVHIMKEKGLFYEVMADAELITKLQPRFAAVWAFHGHNMAYNISVATHTQEERWEWVNAGIRLVRNEGLRHNPNDLVLHKELAFWFAHKIEGYADDAHLYYKNQFAREWHFLLGEPPIDYEERIAWIKRIADAAETLEEAEQRTPGVKALIERIDAAFTPFGESQRFEPTMRFLTLWGNWKAVKEQSDAAELLGYEQRFRTESPFFSAFDEIAADESVKDAWDTLLLYVRKKVLRDEYNMEPERMWRYTVELGPVDWRHGQAHALYWSRKGAEDGEVRVASMDEVYKVINNDRLQLQSLQDLARYGRISFDPFSTEMPGRFPEPRWIDVIEEQFSYFYAKHYETRGGGGETFINFLRNFMNQAIREAYRAGETERAQRLMASMDAKFGFRSDGQRLDWTYAQPLDVFVRNLIRGEVTFNPAVAPGEAVAAMRNAYRLGIGQDRRDVYDQAVTYTDQIIKLYRESEEYGYTTKFGTGRMADLMKDLPTIKRGVFELLLTDPTIHMQEKATIWAKTDKYEQQLRLESYDRVAPMLQEQFARHELSQKFAFNEVFPEPYGLEQYRRRLAEQRVLEQQAAEEARRRDQIGRQE